MSYAEGTGMDTETAADEVIDMIAEIEVQRQTMEQEAGVESASSGALRRLHELLSREREALQLHGPNSAHAANVDAVTNEIERVKKLARATSHGFISRNTRPEPRQVSLRSGTRIPPRNKGRRTMGRAGGR